MTTLPSQLEHLMDLFQEKGSSLYGGEAVTQIAHALQAAHLAELDGRPASVIVAALLHDVGHIFEVRFDRAADASVDGKHEIIGHAILKRWFGPEVTEPVRLHVAAKRYLCATRGGYFEGLSAASVKSLALQGGPMSADEVAAFEAEPHHAAAVHVRVYDDLAKKPNAITPDIGHFKRYLESVGAAG